MFHASPCPLLGSGETELRRTPVLLWPVVIAILAVLALLLTYRFTGLNLDHLIPEGATFLPQYVT